MIFEHKYPKEPGFYWTKCVFINEEGKEIYDCPFVSKVTIGPYGEYFCGPSGGYHKGNLDLCEYVFCLTPIPFDDE